MSAPPTANMPTPTTDSAVAFEPVYAGAAISTAETVATSDFTAAGAAGGTVVTWLPRTSAFAGAGGVVATLAGAVATLAGAVATLAGGLGTLGTTEGSTISGGTLTGGIEAGGYWAALTLAADSIVNATTPATGAITRTVKRESERMLMREV